MSDTRPAPETRARFLAIVRAALATPPEHPRKKAGVSRVPKRPSPERARTVRNPKKRKG